ncbi:hypothetical protein P7K49_022572 [Saguinus oedipus]|uniref:Uncharacterized protein n=1 Tax=Saguinus oedipus TaxID=9490 RepID=A0ABQ9UVT5_SAGOE|nr:hypothetical protein P7K49_022572 [Saguinus oedipus]
MVTVQEEELQVWEQEPQVCEEEPPVREEEPQVWEEELQVQAADMEPLTRKIQIKEDLIKDELQLHVSLCHLCIASLFFSQLLLILEGLVDEQSQLNEDLGAKSSLAAWIYNMRRKEQWSSSDVTGLAQVVTALCGSPSVLGNLNPICGNVVKPSVVLIPQFLSHDQGQLTKELHQHIKSVPSLMQVPEEVEPEILSGLHYGYHMVSACVGGCGGAEEESGELMGNHSRTESPQICFILNQVEFVPELHKISSSLIKQDKPQKKEFVQL